MLIVLNIDRKLLGELLVEAARARSKPMSGRGQRATAGKEREPIRPERDPDQAGGAGETSHVRVAG